jgi:hypothetical protein
MATTTKNPSDGQGKTFGRFESAYLNSKLYKIVREAALKLSPANPLELSQSMFDNGRAEIGYPDAPSARQISTRLKRSWPELVALVLDETRSVERSHDANVRQAEAKWITERHLFFALNRVARLLGLKTLSPEEYDAGRSELIDEDRRRHRYGGVIEENLPSKGQIEKAAARLVDGDEQGWDKALAIARLEPRAKKSIKGTPLYLAIHYYIEAVECRYLPTKEEIRRFGAEAGIGIEALERSDRTIGEHRAECAAYREGLGLPMPTAFPPKGVTPLFKFPPEGYPDATPRRKIGGWNDEEILEALCAYVEIAEAKGRRPTQKHYLSLQGDHPTWPAPSKFEWTPWRKRAEEEVRRRRELAQAA